MKKLAKTAGIVAEFNPFHNGHAYLINEAKKVCDTVVCVMSGSFVQRGEPAFFPSQIRANAAILSGADFVAELPTSVTLCTARDFAYGAVKLLRECSVDTLVFGSECGNIETLKKAAEIENDPRFSEILKEKMADGITYAAARQKTADKICPECSFVFSNPNDTLAVEYIISAKKLGIENFVAVKRIGNPHDSDKDGKFVSSSYIRNAKVFSPYVTGEVEKLYADALKNGEYADYEKFDRAAATLLRFAEKEAFSSLNGINEGLDNRLFAASGKYETFSEIAESAKTKRYTLARIRRLLCAAAIGLDGDTQKSGARYIKILGFSKRGEELLRKISKTSKLKIIVRAPDFKLLEGDAKKAYEIERKAENLQSFCFAVSKEKDSNLKKYVVKTR